MINKDETAAPVVTKTVKEGEDGDKLPAPLRTWDIGSLVKTIEAFSKPRDDGQPEIDVSWINSAVNRKLTENRFSPYELINVKGAPYVCSAYGGGLALAAALDGSFACTADGGGSFYTGFLCDSGLPAEEWEKDAMTDAAGAAYGGGCFIVCGSGGKMLRIDAELIKNGYTDPVNPETHNYLNVPQAPYSDIAASGNTFVAVTGDGRIFRSEDKGESWTEAEAPEAVQFTAVTAGAAGVFAAVANNGEKRCAMSADYGQTWTAYEMPEQNQWVDIAYSDTHKTFAACSLDGENRFALWDGENVKWRAVKAPAQNSWRAVAAGGGIFTAVSSDGALQAASSYDGKKWYSIETPAGSWASLVRTARFFIAFSSSGGADGANAMRSSNGGLTSALFADTDETKAGQEVSKAVSPKTLHDFINSRLPWSVENGGTGSDTGFNFRNAYYYDEIISILKITAPVTTYEFLMMLTHSSMSVYNVPAGRFEGALISDIPEAGLLVINCGTNNWTVNAYLLVNNHKSVYCYACDEGQPGAWLELQDYRGIRTVESGGTGNSDGIALGVLADDTKNIYIKFNSNKEAGDGFVMATTGGSATYGPISSRKLPVSEAAENAFMPKATIPVTSSLNNVTKSGFYRINPGFTDGPTQNSVNYGQLLVINGDKGDTIVQLAFVHNINRAFFRVGVGASSLTWQPWVEIAKYGEDFRFKSGTVEAASDNGYPQIGFVTPSGNIAIIKWPDNTLKITAYQPDGSNIPSASFTSDGYLVLPTHPLGVPQGGTGARSRTGIAQMMWPNAKTSCAYVFCMDSWDESTYGHIHVNDLKKSMGLNNIPTGGVAPVPTSVAGAGQIFSVKDGDTLPGGGTFYVFGIGRHILGAGGHTSISVSNAYSNFLAGGSLIQTSGGDYGNLGIVGFAWRIS